MFDRPCLAFEADGASYTAELLVDPVLRPPAVVVLDACLGSFIITLPFSCAT